ncbi:helix-turn-helix transcriptional regulator [Luteolibacter ambystomatis]|uniref:Helix-turn-helix transcriptional regulator n=1 Tax=Luteolibacter ambystomatis TaxID=2824561 RepID=A0A975G953_9BACT|nr:AraC family transcriptional regulator [Luteolibacter ambystomatis]QUE51127.1 helix-turn-helix transcriptional regulator [Luteolibacter ambystomatis]
MYSPLGAPPTKDQIVIHEVGYLARNYWWVFPNTVSPFWRLYYNSRSGHKMVIGDREVELEPGHLVIIPDHVLFHPYGTEAVPHFWIAFSPGLLLAKPGPLLLPVSPEERGLVERICGKFTGPAEGDRFAIYHQSAALLHLVVSREEIGWNDAERSPVLVKVTDYIARNFVSLPDVPVLAKMAGVSARTLSAMFQREYHVSPTRFIARVRTSEAAKLLAETSLSLDEIAEKTGFPNRYYLTRVFTKLTGKSPARFRKESHAAAMGKEEP